MTRWKGGDPYVTRQYRRHLVIANVLSHYSRGKWQVLAHIPDFVTVNMLEANRGSKHYFHGKWVLRGKPWNANMENPKTEDIRPTDSQSTSTITIYKIVDKHVQPTEVLKTQVSALLSTGSYFEEELDAWYFISMGTGYAVEDLKLKWNKQQELANTIVEETKVQEKAEEELINEMLSASVERLDGLLTIIKSGWSSRIKYWYGFKELNEDDGPRVIKFEVREEQVCKNNMDQHESLLGLLKLASEEVGVHIDDIIEDNLEMIEYELHEKLDAELREKEKLKSQQLITFEDIRGKDVYYQTTAKEWQKAAVIGFTAQALGNGTPEFNQVHVRTKTGSTHWTEYKLVKFSKEEVLKLVTESINSL